MLVCVSELDPPTCPHTSNCPKNCHRFPISRILSLKLGALDSTIISLPATRDLASEMRLLPGDEAGRSPLFCLAPRGVCPATLVAQCAVGSYSTFSPLPELSRAIGGIFSAALSVKRSSRISCPHFSRGTLPCGVRTFLYHASMTAIVQETARLLCGGIRQMTRKIAASDHM